MTGRENHIVRHLKLAVILFLLFFFIYSINFTFLPAFTSQLIAAAVLLYMGLKWMKDRDLLLTVDHAIRFVFTIYATYLLWVFYRTVMTDFMDFGFLANAVLLLGVVFVGSLFFAAWFYRSGYSFRSLMRFIQVVILIQAVFIIFYFFSWEFKELTLLYIPEGDGFPALHPFRSRGLTHQAGASLAAFQATGMLISVYLIVKAKSWGETLFDISAIVVLSGSVLVTGRTGFVILPFILGYLTLYTIYRSGISRKLLVSTALFPLVVIGFFSLMQFLFLQYTGDNAADAIAGLSRWVFVELGELVTTGGSRTTDVLIQQHWFLPEQASHLLVGDPTTHSLNRVSSDIGIVRWIFGTGLVGILLLYTFVIAVLYESAKRIDGLAEKLFIFVLAIWLFTLEFKEPFVSDFRFASLYMIIFCYVVLMPMQKAVRYRLDREPSEQEE